MIPRRSFGRAQEPTPVAPQEASPPRPPHVPAVLRYFEELFPVFLVGLLLFLAMDVALVVYKETAFALSKDGRWKGNLGRARPSGGASCESPSAFLGRS